MKSYIAVCIFPLLLIITVPADVQYPPLDQNPNPVSSIINQIMKEQKMTPSQHIAKCFTPQQNAMSELFVKNFLKIGTESASSVLSKQLSLQENNYLYKNLSETTLSCLKGSNDMRILWKNHFNISPSQDGKLFLFGNEKFVNFTKLNFYKVHYAFSNMSSILDNKEKSKEQIWIQIGSLMRILLIEAFGSPPDDPWTIRAQNVQKMNEYYGISVSNGVLGAVSSSSPFRLSSTVLAGVYDKIGRGRVDNLVQTFPALSLEFYFNGRSNYYNFAQEVKMSEGSMTHSFSGDAYSVSYTYYALRNLPFVFFTDFQITAHQDGKFTIKNVQSAPDHLLQPQKNYQQIDTSKQIYSILSTLAKTKTGKVQMAIASSFIFPKQDSNLIKTLHEDWDSDLHLQKFQRSLKKGESFKFSVATSLMSSEHHEDPQNEVIRMVIRAASMTDVKKGHKQKWAKLWESDIVIEGNEQDQKNVRNMLYHCYSFLNEDRTYGVSPMGLSGLGYNGHIFWDMDLWIYQGILALRPSLAKNMIQYRVQRLASAKQNAFINGYKGAMYPWQSSKTGVEETPVWAMSGPLEHHISGCVAFAAWNYYQITQDKDWLREKGFDVIWSVAQFFASRVQIDNEGNFHIRNVVAADEWAENVDDDAFTNGVAKVSLEIANKAAKILNYTQNSEWDKMRQKIVILKFAGTNVTQEHSTYSGQPIKQADVNLLAFPLKIYTKNQDILRDLQYYEGRVPDAGTPAMTYSIFSLLYSRLKNPDLSYKNFKESFTQFLKPPFNVFSQTKGGTNPYFLTGAGGVLQSMIYGYGGYDLTEQGLVKIESSLPKQWKKVTIKLQKKVVKMSSYGVQSVQSESYLGVKWLE